MSASAHTIYVTPAVAETLKVLDLTDDQMQQLDDAVECLAQPALPENRIVFADGSESGGLREFDRNGFRIQFRLDPKTSTVMVADIRPAATRTASSAPAQETASV